MTNLLVGDFTDFIFLKSFVVGIFLLATRADNALFHYHSPTMLYNLSFPFSLFCECFVAKLIVNFIYVKAFVIKAFVISFCLLVPAKSFAMVRYFYLAYFNPITSFWPTLAICLCVIGKYYLLLVTYTLDGSVPFSRLLFRILTRIVLIFSNFY